ncbi:MAG: AAA family ATPase [Candidatus Micrarchaeia archaeon]
MLSKIELTNWKTHGHTLLNFSKGTNILIGQMGAGKSSVMDAIAYALFGKYPALQHRHLAAIDVITNRPVQMQEASVRLYFDIDGNAYDVTRSIGIDGSVHATLNRNGAYMQSQPQRVTEEIEKILKLDYDLFVRAVYAEQNRLTYFLELSPSERKKEIDELLGLNLFANALDNTTTLANKIKDLAEEASATAKGFDIEKQKQQLEELRESLSKLEKEKAQTEKEHAAAKAEADAKEKDLARANAALAKKQELTKTLASLKSKADMLEKEIAKIKEQVSASRSEVEAQMAQKAGLVDKLRAEQEQASNLEKKLIGELAAAGAEIKQLEKESEELRQISDKLAGTSSKDVNEQIEKLKAQMTELQERKAAYASAKRENEKWLEELSKHVAKCPVCERDLTDEMIEELTKSKSKAIEEANMGMNKTESEAGQLQKEISSKEKLLAEIAAAERRAKELEDSAEKLKKAMAARLELETKAQEAAAVAKKKMEELQRENEELSKLKTVADAIIRKEGHEKELATIEEEIGKAEKELASISISDTEVEALRKSHTEARTALGMLKAKLDSYDRLFADLNKQLSDKQDQVNRINKLYEDIERKKKIATELAKYKNALASTQTELRASLVEYINRTMQMIWPELYPYGDYTGIKLEPTDEDYVLMLHTGRHGSEWEAVEAIASGGERSIACLAMRVAFSLVLVPNLKWLILDEPTHNIDQHGIEKFVKAIGEALPKYVEQVFIITHDEQLRQAQNAKIYVFGRDKSTNGQTAVEQAY